MEKINMIKHMVSSNKKTVHYTFKMMVSLQEQIENMVIPYLDQYEIPKEDKKEISDWLNKTKKSRDGYQQLIEEGAFPFSGSASIHYGL